MLLQHTRWFSIVCRGFFFFQAEDGIRDLVRSRGLGDVYKRQAREGRGENPVDRSREDDEEDGNAEGRGEMGDLGGCLLYTSDAADERSSVDLGGRRIIKKKNRYMTRLAR